MPVLPTRTHIRTLQRDLQHDEERLCLKSDGKRIHHNETSNVMKSLRFNRVENDFVKTHARALLFRLEE